MSEKDQVKCPSCGTSIDVQDIISHQLEAEIKEKYAAERSAERHRLAAAEAKLLKEQETFAAQKKQDNELFQDRLDKQLKQDRVNLEAKLKAKLASEKNEEVSMLKKELDHKSEQVKELNRSRVEIEKLKRSISEQAEVASAEAEKKYNENLQLERAKIKKLEADKNELRIQELQAELNEKSSQVKELNRGKAEIERLKRQNSEIKDLAEAEAEKKLNERLLLEKDKIRKIEQDKNEMQIRELAKQLQDQRKLTEEMKRKQEQGSMQLQGEVQELAMEEWLMAQFPLDSIEEVKKGARGGDCVQTVNTRTKQICGKIYYESKRTKEFQANWIEKFKNDMREKGADIGVLVTEAMPLGCDRMVNMEGVWVCSYDEFKALCGVLRESVIKISTAIGSQENKGDKMHMLYDFLTGTTFRMQVEAIVEGFSCMKSELDREKRAMAKIWKEREKQIDKVVFNTTDMYGSIRGIAGNAIQSVKALELGEGDD